MTPVEGPAATVGALLIGFVFAIVVVFGFVAVVQASDWFATRRDAKAEHDALVGRRTESWCRNWLDGRAADEARMVQRVREGKEHVRTWPPRRAKSTTRLADFAAEQKRRSA